MNSFKVGVRFGTAERDCWTDMKIDSKTLIPIFYRILEESCIEITVAFCVKRRIAADTMIYLTQQNSPLDLLESLSSD